MPRVNLYSIKLHNQSHLLEAFIGVLRENHLLVSNKRLHRAYAQAEFAVQRERIESHAGFFLAKSLLSTFHCINMECVKIKSLELVDAMTNWKYENR